MNWIKFRKNRIKVDDIETLDTIPSSFAGLPELPDQSSLMSTKLI